MTAIELPKTKHQALLCDPPWSFRTFNKDRKAPPTQSDTVHYDVMSLADMKALDVAATADKDCALFLWIVDAHLLEALELAAAWGFTYKTIAFAWKKLTPHGKDHIGMGYWSRKQIELCLLFTRGKPARLGKGIRQLIESPPSDKWITAKRREHSRKPDEQYERIEGLVNGPYLEMFARQTRKGWSAWGNETRKFDKPFLRRDILDLIGKSTKSVRHDIDELIG